MIYFISGKDCHFGGNLNLGGMRESCWLLGRGIGLGGSTDPYDLMPQWNSLTYFHLTMIYCVLTMVSGPLLVLGIQQ